MAFTPQPVYTAAVTNRISYCAGSTATNGFVTPIGPVGPMRTDLGIFVHAGKPFQVFTRANYNTPKTSFNATGRSFLSVWGAPTLGGVWSEKDSSNAPEYLGGFGSNTVQPPGPADQAYQVNGSVVGHITAVQVGSTLWISYFKPIAYVLSQIIAAPYSPGGQLSVVPFDMATETYGTPDVSTAIYNYFNGDNVLTQGTVWGLFPLSGGRGSNGSGQAVYRQQNTSIYIYETIRTIIDGGIFWNRAAYARYVIGTGWLEELNPVDSWHPVGSVGGNHDQGLGGVAISADGIIRLLIEDVSYADPSNPNPGNMTENAVVYQTQNLADVLSSPQDTGIFVEYFVGSDELLCRPRVNGLDIGFAHIEPVPGHTSQRLVIKVSTASLVGSAPAWNTRTAVDLPAFNALFPNIAGAVLSPTLATLLYAEYHRGGVNSATFRVGVSQKVGNSWNDGATPAVPVPLTYTNYNGGIDPLFQYLYAAYWGVDAGSTIEPGDPDTTFVGLTGCLWTEFAAQGPIPPITPVFGPLPLIGGEPSRPYVLNGCLLGVKRFKDC